MYSGLCRRHFLLALACGGVVAACGNRPPPLLVGLNDWPANDLYFLAEHSGYYADAPLRMADYAAAEQGLQAFRNGVVDLYPCTLDEALLLASAIPDTRVVQVLDDSFGADTILALPSFTGLLELRGRRIGYEATALGAYVLARGLELAGLSPADVVPVHLNVDQHESALLEKQVDAVVTYEPVQSRLLAAGARVLFDSRQIPGEIVDVLVSRAATIETRASAVEALVGGWFRAARLLGDQPNVAAEALAPRMRLPASRVLGAFAGIRLADLAENRRLFQGNPPPLRATAQRLMDVMTNAALLESPPDLGALFDGRIVDRITPRKGDY